MMSLGLGCEGLGLRDRRSHSDSPCEGCIYRSDFAKGKSWIRVRVCEKMLKALGLGFRDLGGRLRVWTFESNP